MFERFTDNARAVVKQAQAVSREMGATWIGTEHLLLAMLTTPGLARQALEAAGVDEARTRQEIEIFYRGDADALQTIGIDLDAVRAKVEETFGPGALDLDPPKPRRRWFRKIVDHSPFTPRSRKVLELSLREALALKHNYIGTEHILLGLIREGNGLATRILTDADVDMTALRESVVASIPAKR
jgi:ATP-dependent Clp protease ATP-binding subunit ClpA